MPRARKARTLVDDVHAMIRADILAGQLVPGQPLRMAVLRDRFDVSLSVVREALTRLSEQRLVRSVSQLGFTVVPLSADDLRDLTSVRIDVESMVVRRAVAGGDHAWEAALREAQHRLEASLPGTEPRPASDDSHREAHAEFHTRLADGCPSPRLREIRARLFDAAELYRYWQVPEQRGVRLSGDAHAAICQAALRRDADAAADLVAAHIQAAADRLLSGPSRPDSGGTPADPWR